MLTIADRQNAPDLHLLLRAAEVAHARASRLDTLRLSVSLLLAVLALVATIRPSSAGPVTVAGALWGILYSLGGTAWGSRQLRRAAQLQEQFDTLLFGLPWNPVAAGDPVAPHEAHRLSQMHRRGDDMIADYYEVPDLPEPYDVLACQVQSLAWGARVRRRYANVVGAAAGLWALAGLVIAVAADLTVGEALARWYVPSLGLLLLGLDTARRQHAVASERDRVLSIVRAAVSTATGTHGATHLVTLARQVQDLLFHTRVRVPRVPNWFFARFRAADRADFQATMAEFRNTVRSSTGRPQPPDTSAAA